MELTYIATTTTYNDGVTETEQTFKVSDDNTTITLTQSEAKELCEKLIKALGNNEKKVTPEELRLVATEGKISAIVAYRKRTGAGLREAKDDIDAAMADSARWGHVIVPKGTPTDDF